MPANAAMVSFVKSFYLICHKCHILSVKHEILCVRLYIV